jgi:hypothetical protein
MNVSAKAWQWLAIAGVVFFWALPASARVIWGPAIKFDITNQTAQDRVVRLSGPNTSATDTIAPGKSFHYLAAGSAGPEEESCQGFILEVKPDALLEARVCVRQEGGLLEVTRCEARVPEGFDPELAVRAADIGFCNVMGFVR